MVNYAEVGEKGKWTDHFASSFHYSFTIYDHFFHISLFLHIYQCIWLAAFSIKGEGFRPENTIRAGSRNLISYGLAF
jgi:hypothetical protein